MDTCSSHEGLINMDSSYKRLINMDRFHKGLMGNGRDARGVINCFRDCPPRGMFHLGVRLPWGVGAITIGCFLESPPGGKVSPLGKAPVGWGRGEYIPWGWWGSTGKCSLGRPSPQQTQRPSSHYLGPSPATWHTNMRQLEAQPHSETRALLTKRTT